MDSTLLVLRAAGEPTRLRLLAILANIELTVSELCRLLGQSQPRVSRHLKILCDAGLLTRTPEGAWVFYRLVNRGNSGRLARAILDQIPDDDPLIRRDADRLELIKAEHREAATQYFARSAHDWERLRKLYLANPGVEAAMLAAVKDQVIEDFIDLGTGDGKMLEVFGERVETGLGIDTSREMLVIARANLEAAGLKNCTVRQADVTNLTLSDASADVISIHHVLHFLDEPADVISSAARLLRPDGCLLVVDFARHQQEAFREQFAHRRLGFTDKEVRQWCHNAGLDKVIIDHFGSEQDTSNETDFEVPPVTLWIARRKQLKRTIKSSKAA